MQYADSLKPAPSNTTPLFSLQGAQALMDEKWPDGQVVKTGASHAPNGSSTLPRVTTFLKNVHH